ncbi:UvrD-helicase domain-containing protein [Adlercreutzia equolifaciens]|uniref:UvrD-helicase domain-containing protein n=1 Tax=Adlercreutzia equolifaciens TaxID=446660 RepID=UPI003AF0892D
MTLELAPTPTAALIEGGVGCGKTAALIARVATFLEDGAAPEDMLVLAATPDAARVLGARLTETAGERGAAIEVTCAREVALGLLASEEGRAFSGRAGRLVTPLELGFIMEDMKTSGLKQRRLREMLKFFYRNWTELAGGADDDDRWLIPGEEADTHALLKDVLRFTGGILEPEAAAMAVRFLLACPEVLASAQRTHVLVDDYQMHSRASQHLANLLARDSVTVAADPTAVVEVFDSYPYGEGIGEFAQANEDCERVVLNESHACAAAAWAASRLRTSLDAGAASSDTETEGASFTALEAADPAAEMAAVADAVQVALEAGTNPSSIYILAFHPAWERRIARALEARGIAAALPIRGRVAAGDYRDLDRCAPARLLTALALVADPTDALAWRAWCGFGDYLANSAAFADMRAEGETQGKGLVAMLEKVAVAAPEEGFPGTGIGRILDAYRAGRALVERLQGLEGNELIGALADALDLSAEERERTVQLASALTAPEPGVNAPSDARAMIARARQRMNAPVFETTEGHVLIGDSAHLTGLTPATLVLCGFVNGFFPTRDFFDATVTTPDKQKLVRATDTRRLYAAAGKATQRLAASWFTSIGLVEAETLKLEIGRVKLRRGERIAVTAPSIYLADIDPGAETRTAEAAETAAAAPSS